MAHHCCIEQCRSGPLPVSSSPASILLSLERTSGLIFQRRVEWIHLEPLDDVLFPRQLYICSYAHPLAKSPSIFIQPFMLLPSLRRKCCDRSHPFPAFSFTLFKQISPFQDLISPLSTNIPKFTYPWNLLIAASWTTILFTIFFTNLNFPSLPQPFVTELPSSLCATYGWLPSL